ncbi:hypothetical protein MTO96_008379 [Rhipicephalus appendiculatus]
MGSTLVFTEPSPSWTPQSTAASAVLSEETNIKFRHSQKAPLLARRSPSPRRRWLFSALDADEGKRAAEGERSTGHRRAQQQRRPLASSAIATPHWPPRRRADQLRRGRRGGDPADDCGWRRAWRRGERPLADDQRGRRESAETKLFIPQTQTDGKRRKSPAKLQNVRCGAGVHIRPRRRGSPSLARPATQASKTTTKRSSPHNTEPR